MNNELKEEKSLVVPEPAAVSHRKLSSELMRLKELCSSETISLHTLIENITSRSHGLLSLFFSLPFFLPIPVPGLSVLFGLIIMAAGIAMALNNHPWIPKKMLSKNVSTHLLQKMFEYGVKMSRGLEKFIKPRGMFILRHPGMRSLNGILIAICGFLLALPLPPGTNFPPAIAILLLSLSSLEEDVILMFVGYIVFILNIALFAGVFIFGVHQVKALLTF